MIAADDQFSLELSSDYFFNRVNRAINYYSAPGRVAGYCFRAISYFLSVFLCQQHYEKTAGPICMKFLGKVWSDHGTT